MSGSTHRRRLMALLMALLIGLSWLSSLDLEASRRLRTFDGEPAWASGPCLTSQPALHPPPPPPFDTMATNISKKRKFVADGVFYAELNEV